MRRRSRWLWPLLLCLLSYPRALHSQFEENFGFGQNHVVFKDFDWKVFSTEHFDVYYYEGSAVWAPQAARYLEKHYEIYSKLFDVKFRERRPFFLYASVNDMEQSNVVQVGDGTGGVTEPLKDRFMVYNDGSQEWLEDVCTHELMHEFQFEVLLGGFWKSIRIIKLAFYPQWFMEGMAEWGTGDQDAVTENMVIRDGATYRDGLYPLSLLQNFAHLKPHQVTLAYKEGSEVFHFIEDEYGADKIPEMLKLIASRFEVATVVLDILGVDFKDFDRKFREYVSLKYEKVLRDQGLKEPLAYGDALTRKEDNIPVFNVAPVFTPDGRSFAYLSDRRGAPPELYIQDVKTGRRRLLVGHEFQYIDDIPYGNFSQYSRALALSPDGRRLAVFLERNHRDSLALYDLAADRLELRALSGFMRLAEPSFAPDGKSLVFSGMKDGITDIYRYDLKTQDVTQLTNDPQDDQSPAFSPDGREIVYSSEINDDRAEDPHQRGLYLLNPADRSIRSLPRLPGRSRDPIFSPDGKRILFANDMTGVMEIYEMDAASGKTRRLTRTVGGNFTPVYVGTGTIAFVSYRFNDQHVFLGARARFLDETVPTLAAGETQPGVVPVSALAPTPGEKDWIPVASTPAFSAPASTATAAATAVSSAPVRAPFLAGAGRPYRFQASTDLFLPAFFYSSPGGLFWSSYFQASDLLGNHLLASSLDYNSGQPYLDYSASYTYARFTPQIVISATGYDIQGDYDFLNNSYVNHYDYQEEVGALYPFDRYHRLELFTGAESVYANYTSLGVVQTAEYRFASIAAVRDTVTGRYLVPVEGTRVRVEYQKDWPVAGGNQQLDVVGAEFQKYFPLGGQQTLATRLTTQWSDGPDFEIFDLAGVPGGVRGLDDNTLNNYGEYIGQATIEYRFPIIQEIDRRIALLLPDVYFKSLYGVVFDDIGANYDSYGQVRSANWGNSQNGVGVGLRLFAFILQSTEIEGSLDWAMLTSSRGNAFYFYLGPSF